MQTAAMYKPAVAAAAAAEVTAGSPEPLSDAHVPASASAAPPCVPAPGPSWLQPLCPAENLQHQQHCLNNHYTSVSTKSTLP